MQDIRIQPGSVVQISPAYVGHFPGCFLTVEEVRSWGVQGHVAVPGRPVGHTYARVAWSDLAYVGEAVWLFELQSGEAEQHAGS